MSRRVLSDDEPPSYQDAVVQGIYSRSGKTPFPDAPRLNPRGLDGIAPLHHSLASIKKLMDPSVNKPPIAELSDKKSKRSNSSGWQSDTSYVKPHRSAPSTAKRKNVTFSLDVSAPDVAECRIVPLLAYHPRRPILYLNLTKPSWRMKVMGDLPTTFRDSDLDQPATSPLTAHMQITINDLSADVDVRNKRGVTIRDVINTLRDYLYVNISHQAWNEVKQPYRDRVKLAFKNRCEGSELLEEAERRKGLRRVDLLCENVIWKGLAPDSVKTNVWVLTLSPA